MTTFPISNLTNGFFAIAASAIVLGFAAVPAEAADVAVRISAHELAAPAGRAAVESRIDRAAKMVCGGADRRDLGARADEKACIAKAVADARLQVAALQSRTQMASR